MASTNKTTNYNLSQFVGTDKPTWLGDYNGDMGRIDAQMKVNADNIATAISGVETATSTANQANTTAGQANTTAQSASSTATQASTTASNAQTTANSALSTATTAQTTANSVATDVGDLTNLNTTDKTSVVGAINSTLGTLLWTNPNPNNQFGDQNITLSSSDYDVLEVFFISHVTNERDITCTRAIKGFNFNIQTDAENGILYERKFTRTNDLTYSVSTGYVYTSYSSGKTATNNVCVPLYIIGYKDLFLEE